MLKDKIKQIRIEKGMTIQELSELTGLSVASLSMYETGKRIPSIKNISKIAEALKISVDELFNDKISTISEDELIIKKKVKDLEEEITLKRANGKCDLCGQNAPFITEDGQPYLVTKSIFYEEVKKSYIFAVCPNCWARLTVLDFIGDKRYLFRKYQEE